MRYDFETTEPEHRFTVKAVVHDPELARLEAERLDRVNAGKRCRYFVQHTRLFAPGTSAGTWVDEGRSGGMDGIDKSDSRD